MILTDGIHLVSDTNPEELHLFARGIGLKRSWYQDVSGHPHYDLTTKRAAKRAIAAGARVVTSQDLVRQAWWTEATT